METKTLEVAPVFNQLPDLLKLQPAPLGLDASYWTPNEVGESKRVFFMDIRVDQTLDERTGEFIDLETVYLVEPTAEGNNVIRQSSKWLVGVFERNADKIKEGTPFEITYRGKKRTKSGNMCDTWTVVPLILPSNETI